MECSDYYPDGMRFESSTSNSAALPYRYNGKELEAMNGMNEYDYGARRRETGIPVWTTRDPMAERRPWMSPYAYCSDNPINRIDPDGKDDYFDSKGNFVRHIDTKVNNILIISGKSSKSLTSYNYSSKNTANRSMLSAVGTYYANKAGIMQKVGVVDVNTFKAGAAMASTNSTNLHLSINVDQETGKINREAGNADNVTNSFVHEGNHIDNPNLMGTPEGELKAIQAQVLDPSFTNTTSSFKGAAVSYAAKNLNLEIQYQSSPNVQANILNLNSIFSKAGGLTLYLDMPSNWVDYNLNIDEYTVIAPRINK
jgi:RHS repeat-associated protein